MTKTEKRYWVNGHQVRGGWFHTWNFSLMGFGIMISNGDKKVELFKLI